MPPAREPHTPLRVGVYADLVYRRLGEATGTDRAFVLFVLGLAERVDELVLFGRLHPEEGPSPYRVDERARHVPLPHYPKVTDVVGVLRAMRGTVAKIRREAGALDVVWIFGPYPISVLVAAALRRAGVPLVLGVRQDFPAYVRSRLPGRGWAWAVPAARLLELAFRLLARRAPTVVVGEALAARYRGGRAPVLATGFSLIRTDDVAAEAEALARAPREPLRILTVGRIDAEKNPLLLPEILVELRSRGIESELTVVGSGPLEAELRARAAELGVALDLRGYVPAGAELWRLYREADVFLHVSLTEGLPQVLYEARAAGLPVVATEVGGVRAALEDGEGGLLVPPRDAAAAAVAVACLAREPELRERLIRRGLAAARAETADVQLDAILPLLRAAAISSA